MARAGFRTHVPTPRPLIHPTASTHPSSARFTAFVQLKDFRRPAKKEYVRYVRRLGDHYQCDPATLTEEQVRAYYLELREVRKLGASAMKAVKCAYFQDCLRMEGWTVFAERLSAPDAAVGAGPRTGRHAAARRPAPALSR